MLTACETIVRNNTNDDQFLLSGDFLYQIVEMNDEGLQIVEGSENKNCVEKFVRIRGLSDEGKKKEIIIVPQILSGFEVKEIAAYINFDSKSLIRVYIPFQINIWGYGSGKSKNAPNLEKIVIMCHNTINNKLYTCYISSLYQTDVSKKIISHTNIRYANLSYIYNYEGAPNYGYYWIDDYGYGETIKYVPVNPERTGYVFDGWYKEAECINKWDFKLDILPDKEKDDENNWLYPEIKLYAKWLKE